MNCNRKRTYSAGCNNNNIANANNNNNNNNNNSKRRRRSFAPNKRTFIPPTKFLLGGNIRDPLNLCGLPNEEISETVVRSCDTWYPHFADFLLGGDVHDPLNLKSIEDVKNNEPTTSEPLQNIDNIVVSDDGTVPKQESQTNVTQENNSVVPNSLKRKLELPLESGGVSLCKKFDKKDKIVSPVIPQPYRPLKNVHFCKHQIITPDTSKGEKTPRFKEKNCRFQYGNYNRYYGHRNANHGVDLRLEILSNHKEFFAGKDILDIGCNIGHISLIVARDFNAKSVIGMDIDRSLIDIAKKNIKYYVNCASPYTQETPPSLATENKKVDLKNNCYPVSMPILYGAVDENDFNKQRSFPKNVSFIQGNYVLEDDTLLSLEQPQFDTILCFSTTKWLHLNWGDVGLKRAFRRIFLQLRPGGVLIIEPQSWDSYKKKKALTEAIWRNYQNIQLFPHHFDRYLLAEVGFSRCQTIAVVNHEQKGFRRPLKIFIKR